MKAHNFLMAGLGISVVLNLWMGANLLNDQKESIDASLEVGEIENIDMVRGPQSEDKYDQKYGIKKNDRLLASESLAKIWPGICNFNREELGQRLNPICLLIEIQKKNGRSAFLLDNYSKALDGGVTPQGMPVSYGASDGISPFKN